MAAPTEIIAGPLEAYIGPVGESFPAIGATPAGNWTLIGTSGSKNYTEDGVRVQHPQEFYEVLTAGTTIPRKVFRTREDLIVTFTLYDIKAAEYSRVLNSNSVTTTAAASGVPGQRTVSFERGVQVEFNALLLRGALSPEQDDANVQYEVPRVYHNGSPEVVWTKGEATGLIFEFMALLDETAADGEGLGRYRYQFADATA